MGLPAKLKNFVLFNAADSYQGQVSEITLPKLTLKTDDWRGAGMLGEVKVDMGIDPQPIECKAGGYMAGVMRQFGVAQFDGVLLRFVGAYQADDSGRVFPAELIVRGRHTEIDPGTAKAGDSNDFGWTTAWTYLKWTVGGFTDVEIDLVNMVLITGGIDRMADVRAALGL
jgi:uncharacterized protein